jgi:glycosyltransferase involved in cell wall biosynthesis
MTAYNEEDVIASSVGALLAQGVEVHLIDNWSTDQTVERALSEANRGRLTWERFPADGPASTYRWRDLLGRVDDLAAESGADWCIHHDADERRLSPWAGVSLRDGLHHVQRCGFNAVDHTLLNFWPVDETYVEGADPEDHFRHFGFGEFDGHFIQVKAWRNPGHGVRLADFGGHDVNFPGLRIYPYNFLIKHYSIRSQAHGERKVFEDRVSRWDPEERAGGWHIQYDHVAPGHRFLRDASTLHLFDQSFARRYLTERLSHVGIRR